MGRCGAVRCGAVRCGVNSYVNRGGGYTWCVFFSQTSRGTLPTYVPYLLLDMGRELA